MEWSAKQVVVTGLAHSSWRNCRSVAVQNAIVPRSKAYDLRDRDAIIRLYKETRPHIVLHLAAVALARIGPILDDSSMTTRSWEFN